MTVPIRWCTVTPSMTERATIEDQPESLSSLRLLHDALGTLMRSDELSRGDVAGAIALVTETASRLLEVARASVWRLGVGRGSIECSDLYEKVDKAHSSGVVLKNDDAPAYFEAIGHARAIAAHDAHTDPRTQEFTESYLAPLGITSMLDAPILLRGDLVGVLCLEHVGAKRYWRSWEQLVAGTLADVVAMAFAAGEHAAQRNELRAYHEELEKVVLQRTDDLRRAEQNFRDLFALAPVSLVVSRKDDGTLIDANERAGTMFGLTHDDVSRVSSTSFWVRPEDREGFLAKVLREGRVDRFEAELRSLDDKRFWAELSAGQTVFDGAPALLVGIHDVTEQRRVEERLRLLATLDGLTGLVNRRSFFEVAEAETSRATRYGHTTSFAMIDVDHFKLVNDELGHAAGDRVLTEIAARVRSGVRRMDVVARYGGEEFVILFPETGLAAAEKTLERIRASIADSPIDTGVVPRTVTVSLGVAERGPDESLADVLKRADAALYEAKANGRNRLVSVPAGPLVDQPND